MKNMFKKVMAGFVVVASMALVMTGLGVVSSLPAHAACDPKKGMEGALQKDCSKGEGQAEQLDGNQGVITTIINTMLFIVGLLAVIMIIYAGIRFVTAHGDEKQVESARQTIIYSVVGLIVAILAYALVNWVFTQFK